MKHKPGYFKKLLKEHTKVLKEQGGTLTSQEQIWSESGCLVPDDLYYCPECTRDCVGEEHQGYVEVTGAGGINWEFPFGNDIHDYGHTCCCIEDYNYVPFFQGPSWMWEAEPGVYEKIHDWRNPCCYGDVTNGSGQYGAYAVTSNHPSPNFTCTQIEGCLDPNAWNYDPGASFDCIGQPQNGMITQTIFGNETDFFDFLGPNNQLGDTCCCEYSSGVDPEGNVSDYDSSCGEYENYINPPEEEILGCTDPDASNYNPDANTDDGSCEWDPFSTETSPLRKPIKCYKCEKNNSITLPENITILSTVQTLDGNWVITGEVWPGYDGDKATCPKEWTTDPNPCPGVSPVRDYLECYRCDIDGETVLSQSFPQIDEKGCPSPWGPDPDPCNTPGFTTQDEECPLEEFSCDTLNVWVDYFIGNVGWDNIAGMPSWCAGCAGTLGGITSWEQYVQINDPCFVGSLEEACACCPPDGDIVGCMSETAENYDPTATVPCDDCCIWDDGGCATCNNCEDGCCYNFMVGQGCKLAEEHVTGVNPLLFNSHEGYWNSCANENYEFVDTWPNSGAIWIDSPLNDQNLNDYCDGDGSLWNNGSGINTDNTANVGFWAKMHCSEAICCQTAYNWYSSGADNLENWGGIESFNATTCVEFTGPINQGAQGMPVQIKKKKNPLKERFQKLAGIKKPKK